MHQRDRHTGQPVITAPPSGHRRALETAIQRSQDYLLREQKPEGYWVGELMVDSTLVSDTIAYHHWAGKVDLEWQRKAVNHIFSMQLPDGGWNIYYGGPAEVNATIKAYLALKLAGVPLTDPRMLRAREIALNLGGVPRMNTFSKLSHPHRQMVLCEFQRDEQLEPFHARPAGDHQPLQAHPPSQPRRYPRRTLPGGLP
jgi:hypothetical protein